MLKGNANKRGKGSFISWFEGFKLARGPCSGDKVVIRLRHVMEMTREEFRVEDNAAESKTSKESKISVLVNEFAGYTTLHGFHFVLESCSVVRRILWATLILLALVILAFQCLNGLNKLLEHDSVTIKEQQREDAILFPAVTICNQNMMRKDEIMGTAAQKFLDKIESLLYNGFNNNTNDSFSLDLDKEVRRAGHNISDMLIACFSQGKICKPEDFYVFTSIRVRQVYVTGQKYIQVEMF